ncbi:response regulator with CheY-like receiver, AAA-type ATPase, and DNA-binding domains [Beggiatoa alba B18LD]|uniref:Response regulator with CheY-like receiver, AAA-type ATPase, and DNA-binding domains n=1 Tax=Beggiatoa alba B18LD TaxID=395493 RepID=I3CDF7_9GAMM|nr:sigma-54 dependent transcriptional regulator [Beggiatoa alba]EIJ41650.1 response regulator with CheY-like receiver, AAA-type ATPase, and DNA-binding domains [Beggiatoa alba B18LD]
MNTTAHILVVDDEPDIRNLMKEILEDEGFLVSVAENADTARQLRREIQPDLILLDIWMPDTDGVSLLKEWHDSGLMDTPVIMMSGHGSVETAVEATRLGAYDYIEKPVSISKLLITMKRALEMAILRRENYGLRKHALTVSEPIGNSEIMSALREQVKRINQHDTAVLITGEPGSGRTLFARYIHQNSRRQSAPFVNVRVAGMHPENQALELFGNQNSSTPSRLEQANGGTLFIKDVVDLDVAVQARLLNCLESQFFFRNGGAEPVPIDVRVIAATDYDLDEAINNGHLREDLYYYLNIVPLRIPPLRDHYEDVPQLLDFYTNLFVNQENLPYRRFTVAAQNRLRHYNWPGNVRELKNLVQRLLILGNGMTIELNEVEPILSSHQRQNNNSSNNNQSMYDLPLREAREQFERAYLEHQLQEVGGNVSKVASRVGLERTHLYRKLRALDIDPKQTKK